MARFKVRRPRRIAPRLASGASRIGYGGGLPEEVKEGLRAIAHRENKSMSWVMEEVIIDYFHLRRPEYVKVKVQTEEEKSRERGTLRRVK